MLGADGVVVGARGGIGANEGGGKELMSLGVEELMSESGRGLAQSPAMAGLAGWSTTVEVRGASWLVLGTEDSVRS